MATGEDWSRIEVEACVADYLQMLTLELNGQRYSKAEHARALMQKLDGRSRPHQDAQGAPGQAVCRDQRDRADPGNA